MYFHVGPSLRSGFNGGLIGGTVAGIIIGTSYWLTPKYGHPPASIVPEVTVYAVFVGTMTGLFAQLGIAWFRYLARVSRHFRWVFRAPVGGMIAGLFGGILVGAVGGLWFGLRDSPPPEPGLLVGAALLGSLLLSAAIIVYDSTENSVRALLNHFSRYLMLLAVVALASFTAKPLFLWLGFTEAWFANWTDKLSVIKGGALMGALIGALMGLLIGLAVYVPGQSAQSGRGFKTSQPV